uniref:Myotubularin related protein 11 n=1 Tax=Catharus ustulatus TaxID=91951 RepID=A0A8C3UU80_CATUS
VSVPTGERVLEEAAGARQRCGNGGGSVPGTLLCTDRPLPTLPQAPGSRGLIHAEGEVALPCIHKLVAGNGDIFSKPKVLTAASTLKFIPEELAVFCRDFRLLHFYFPENGLAPQAFRVSQGGAEVLYSLWGTPRLWGSLTPHPWLPSQVANAIAQAREAAAWLGDTAEGPDGWSYPSEASPEEEEEEEGLSTTLLFESLRDWEKELQRLGAAGWRVSAVNERFDMAPSLPQYLWVPSGLLDHDLKRTFAHFQERRVPVSAWAGPGRVGGTGRGMWRHHPISLAAPVAAPWSCKVGAPGWEMEKDGGGWKGAPPHCLVPPEPSDRDLNCLLASLVQLLGDPHARSLPGFQSLVQREWVAAGHPFPRRLGLLCRDAPREEAPVFLLFLDCTWQLLWQFPADFGFTEAFLLALHDSSFSPYFSTFRFSCQRHQGTQGGLLGPCQPRPGLLLPGTAGPCIRLWHRCYLRGLPQEQVLGKLGPGGSALGGSRLGGPSLGGSQPVLLLGLGVRLDLTRVHPGNPVSVSSSRDRWMDGGR